MEIEIGGRTRFLLAASFLGTAAESMLVPIYAPLAHRAGGSIVDAGIGLALFSITTGLFVTTVGMTVWFRNHIRKLLVLGFVLAGMADLGYIFVQTRSELFLVQGVVGLSLGILNPAWDSIYSVGPEDPTRKWAIWTGGINLVTGVSALVGTYVLSHFSFNSVFAAMFLLDLLAAYCSLIALRRPSWRSLQLPERSQTRQAASNLTA
jgi:predicted MFS family arabinose efflux permease